MSNVHLTSDAADAGVTGGPAGTKWKAAQANNSSARTTVKRCQSPHVATLQMTDGAATADGSVVQWFTDPLSAVTITGTVTCSLWCFEPAATVNAAVVIQIERCLADGTVQSVIAANSVNEGGLEVPATAGAVTATIPAASVADTALNDGDRLRVTAWMTDASLQGGTGTLTTATTRYMQMYVNGAPGGSGQAQLAFTETLAVYSPPSGAVIPQQLRGRRLNGPYRRQVAGAIFP